MKCVILLHSRRFRYHDNIYKALLNCDFRCVVEFKKVDFSNKGLLQNKYNEIAEFYPDLIINIDGVGFVLKTESDTLSLNAFPCVVINMMLQKIDYYGQDLNCRQNLSMFTYFSPRFIKENKGLNSIREEYQNIPNIGLLCEYDYKASLSEDIDKNADSLREWMSYVLNDIKLFGKGD